MKTWAMKIHFSLGFVHEYMGYVNRFLFDVVFYVTWFTCYRFRLDDDVMLGGLWGYKEHEACKFGLL